MTSVPVILDAAAVQGRLPDPADVREVLRQAFLDLARGRAYQPAQTFLPLGDGVSDVIVNPAVVAAVTPPGEVRTCLTSQRAAPAKVTAAAPEAASSSRCCPQW